MASERRAQSSGLLCPMTPRSATSLAHHAQWWTGRRLRLGPHAPWQTDEGSGIAPCDRYVIVRSGSHAPTTRINARKCMMGCPLHCLWTESLGVADDRTRRLGAWFVRGFDSGHCHFPYRIRRLLEYVHCNQRFHGVLPRVENLRQCEPSSFSQIRRRPMRFRAAARAR